jgi:hypothetical protein
MGIPCVDHSHVNLGATKLNCLCGPVEKLLEIVFFPDDVSCAPVGGRW